MKPTAKHKFCRRIGSCLWNDATCPSVKRPFPAGAHGAQRRGKLSTYGALLLEKQKLRNFYAISEKQLRIAYARSHKGTGRVAEKLLMNLELRLDSFIFRAGLVPSIFAAKQAVNHGHILVNGKRVDRSSFIVPVGAVVSISAEKSPKIAELARLVDTKVPAYISVEKDACKATLVARPVEDEVSIPAEVMKVIEYYAR